MVEVEIWETEGGRVHEDSHLEAAYEERFEIEDADLGEEECEECAELIEDCICCDQHGVLDCDECEEEEL